jgi:glycosyltransferase involved in cell wall biosynthesis
MKIGFDGKRATNNLTGLGNYSRSLIAHLAQFFPQNQFFVYTPGIKEKPQISGFLSVENILTRLPGTRGILWRTLGIKKQLVKDGIDLFHGLSHEIPAGLHKSGIPAIVTVHDLIFLKFPQYFGRIDRLIYTLKCRYACRHADRIVAISECTKRDIVAFFGTDPSKIEIVYQSCDDGFKSPAENGKKQAVRLKFNLPDHYILNVGTIETRKNLLTLIRAIALAEKSVKLVVVGKRTPYADEVDKEINALGLSSRILFLQDVPFDELPSIYQMAELFVYPSVYEGFGIPIIEALYSGVPVIAAKGSCLEEAGGPDSVYVEPYAHEKFAQEINRLLSQTEIAARMKVKGLVYAQRFDNQLLSTQMMTIYQNLVSDYSNN